jgi:predicted enzyme related to lactoylglutathione lyase
MPCRGDIVAERGDAIFRPIGHHVPVVACGINHEEELHGEAFPPMPNIAYFEIPADDVSRARQFYQSLLGRKIEPNPAAVENEMVASIQYDDVIAGEPQEGTSNLAGLYKRQMSAPFKGFVKVENLEEVLAKVEMQPVALDPIIRDIEGDSFGSGTL